ncbi:MAG: FG-GAP repeat protein, partial [Deltaproteobacteria bacterium]
MRLVPVSVLSCLLVAGCFSSTAVHDCPGEGTYVEAGVGRYCAYGVVIGGFDCPPELPNRFDYPSADPFLPDAMICADRPMDSPDDVPPEVCAFMPACRVGTPGAGGRDASADAGIDPTWTEQAKLTGSDASADALFGFSVAVSGDTAVAGAVWDDVAGTYRGSTYVFVRSGAAWSQQAKLIASGAAPGDEFGASVAVSGDTVVVGAPARDNEGSVYVFVRSGTTWTEQAMLTASDAVAYRFGSSVAVSGDTVVVAGPSDGVNDGSVYVFVRSGTTWTEQAKLTASDAARGLLFGQSVAVSGDTAVVGSNQRSVAGTYSGSAYV